MNSVRFVVTEFGQIQYVGRWSMRCRWRRCGGGSSWCWRCCSSCWHWSCSSCRRCSCLHGWSSCSWRWRCGMGVTLDIFAGFKIYVEYAAGCTSHAIGISVGAFNEVIGIGRICMHSIIKVKAESRQIQTRGDCCRCRWVGHGMRGYRAVCCCCCCRRRC